MIAKVFANPNFGSIKLQEQEDILVRINEYFYSIEELFLSIKNQITSKGFVMAQIELEQASSYHDIMEVSERNIVKINTFLQNLDATLQDNYLLSKEILQTTKVDYVNGMGIGSISVSEKTITINPNANTVVVLNEDGITIDKDGVTKEVSYD